MFTRKGLYDAARGVRSDCTDHLVVCNGEVIMKLLPLGVSQYQ